MTTYVKGEEVHNARLVVKE